MSKTFKITLAVFLLLVVFLTYLEATEPEPVNWTPSYMPQDKIPLGSLVFYENWKNNAPGEIEQINIPPFESLQNGQQKSGTYFFLNNTVAFDDDELDKVLAWVSEGNTLFVSAKQIGYNLLDTLNIERNTFLSRKDLVAKPHINLVHPKLRNEQPYRFTNEFEAGYFSRIDSLNHLVLGTVGFGEETYYDEEVNFIKTSFGKGEILLHTTPQAFGNHFLLTQQNHEYAEGVLSYIKQAQPVFWDNYYKAGKVFYTSPLYILLNNRSLKWAYYFVLFAIVAFIIFEGKRKQRSVPVIEPLKNQSSEYARSIAGLYLEQNRYRELAMNKSELFLEYIRANYRVSTERIDKEFYIEVASRSGNSLESTEELFKTMDNINQRKEIEKKEFLELSRAINNYKNSTDGKQ